jgi:hemolysin activation/secretion protein
MHASHASLPDLVVRALRAPLIARRGNTIYVSVTVANQGTASSGPYRLGLYFSVDSTITTGHTLAFTICSHYRQEVRKLVLAI